MEHIRRSVKNKHEAFQIVVKIVNEEHASESIVEVSERYEQSVASFRREPAIEVVDQDAPRSPSQERNAAIFDDNLVVDGELIRIDQGAHEEELKIEEIIPAAENC